MFYQLKMYLSHYSTELQKKQNFKNSPKIQESCLTIILTDSFTIISVKIYVKIQKYMYFSHPTDVDNSYWVTQKLLQIRTDFLRICIGKVAGFAVCICGNFWVTQYDLTLFTITRIKNRTNWEFTFYVKLLEQMNDKIA